MNERSFSVYRSDCFALIYIKLDSVIYLFFSPLFFKKKKKCVFVFISESYPGTFSSSSGCRHRGRHGCRLDGLDQVEAAAAATAAAAETIDVLHARYL
jgi:hypothetical protein